MPNQGSNLDFTDPESVVLPITPLGTVSAAKIHFFYFIQEKKGVFLIVVKKDVLKVRHFSNPTKKCGEKSIKN